MEHKHIKFTAEGLSFEGILSHSTESEENPVAVLCHPHPLRGGNMDNNVITEVAVALDDASIPNLRFNFRGVGNSEGVHSEGELEYQEILGAQKYVLSNERLPAKELFTVGYSFGSRVILSTSEVIELTSKLVLISPHTDAVTASYLKTLNIPVLIISGSKDHICSPSVLKEYFDGYSDNIEIHEVDGADHFWMGYSQQLTEKIVNHLMS